MEKHIQYNLAQEITYDLIQCPDNTCTQLKLYDFNGVPGKQSFVYGCIQHPPCHITCTFCHRWRKPEDENCTCVCGQHVDDVKDEKQVPFPFEFNESWFNMPSAPEPVIESDFEIV